MVSGGPSGRFERPNSLLALRWASEDLWNFSPGSVLGVGATPGRRAELVEGGRRERRYW